MKRRCTCATAAASAAVKAPRWYVAAVNWRENVATTIVIVSTAMRAAYLAIDARMSWKSRLATASEKKGRTAVPTARAPPLRNSTTNREPYVNSATLPGPSVEAIAWSTIGLVLVMRAPAAAGSHCFTTADRPSTLTIVPGSGTHRRWWQTNARAASSTAAPTEKPIARERTPTLP